MSIRCITFDLDDTLWAADPALSRAENRVYRWLNEHCPAITAAYTPEALIDHRKEYMRRCPQLHHDLTTLRKSWLTFIALEAGYGPAIAEPAFRVFWEARNEVELFPEALAALDAVGRLYGVGAITNGNADVHRIGIGHYFDFVVCSERIGVAKPHHTIFLTALEQAGLSPPEVVHVGDDPVLDIAGAAAVGMRTVWVNRKGQAWPEREPYPDAQISGLDQLKFVLRAWQRD